MAELSAYSPPPGSYVTVRLFPDGWAAVSAHRGAVVALTEVTPDRAKAFRHAIAKAEKSGLECLVSRGVT